MTLALSIPAFVCADVNVQASKQAIRSSGLLASMGSLYRHIYRYIYVHTLVNMHTHTSVVWLAR